MAPPVMELRTEGEATDQEGSTSTKIIDRTKIGINSIETSFGITKTSIKDNKNHTK